MDEFVTVRWRKYGKDRLYVNAADGTRIGWRDLLTGDDHLEAGASARAYDSAVRAWIDNHPGSVREAMALGGDQVPPADGALDVVEASGAPDSHPAERTEAGGAPVLGVFPRPPVPTDNPPIATAMAAFAEVTDPAPASIESVERSGVGGDLPAIDEQSSALRGAPAESTSREARPASGLDRKPGIEGPEDADTDPDLALSTVASIFEGSKPTAPPDNDDTPSGVEPPDAPSWDDLADRRAGASARAEALRLRREKPVRTTLARVLRVHTDERAWRIGADGEEKVAARLAKLAKRDPRWRSLHAIPVGERGSDIDHLVIGPPGVFTLNSKHHPDAKIWVGGDAFMVNGHRQPYVRNSRHEARRAAKLLSAAASGSVVAVGIIVPVGAADVRVKKLPPDVMVINRMRLVKWLESMPAVLSPDRIDALYAAARRSTTWRPPA